MESSRVFDTSALIAFLEGELFGDTIATMIERASQNDSHRLVVSVNLGEVWQYCARKRTNGDDVVNQLLGLGFTVVSADWDLTRIASELKFKYKLSFADSFAAALAKQRKCELVTLDHDFLKLSREIKVKLLK